MAISWQLRGIRGGCRSYVVVTGSTSSLFVAISWRLQGIRGGCGSYVVVTGSTSLLAISWQLRAYVAEATWLLRGLPPYCLSRGSYGYTWRLHELYMVVTESTPPSSWLSRCSNGVYTWRLQELRRCYGVYLPIGYLVVVTGIFGGCRSYVVIMGSTSLLAILWQLRVYVAVAGATWLLWGLPPPWWLSRGSYGVYVAVAGATWLLQSLPPSPWHLRGISGGWRSYVLVTGQPPPSLQLWGIRGVCRSDVVVTGLPPCLKV